MQPDPSEWYEAVSRMPVWSSRVAVYFATFAVFLLFFATYAGSSPSTTQERDDFLCNTAREWRRHYVGPDLQVVVADVVFHGSSTRFVYGEGAVVAPIALNLPDAQVLLAVQADPAPIRVLHVEGIAAVVWSYAGALHRDLTYRALALVRRAGRHKVVVPESPTFLSLPEPWRIDARQTAEDLETEEHALDECKAFRPALTRLAGDPPYTDQLLRVVQRLQESRSNDLGHGHTKDLCAALRSGSLDVHDIQVLAVLAMRAIGAPALGFTTPEASRMYLVGTYVDGAGWITVDANRPSGFEGGGPPLLTMAPLAAPFQAAQHGFWYPSASAYAGAFGRTMAFTTTRWAVSPSDDDATVPSTIPLDETCP